LIGVFSSALPIAFADPAKNAPPIINVAQNVKTVRVFIVIFSLTK
jgi:hypothetical protein